MLDLVRGSSGVEFPRRFRNAWLSGGLNRRRDLSPLMLRRRWVVVSGRQSCISPIGATSRACPARRGRTPMVPMALSGMSN
jgi:hypothetical protein